MVKLKIVINLNNVSKSDTNLINFVERPSNGSAKEFPTALIVPTNRQIHAQGIFNNYLNTFGGFLKHFNGQFSGFYISY